MAHQTCLRRRLPMARAFALIGALSALTLPATTASGATLQPEQGTTLTISAFHFEPSSLTINAGDSITWVNTDGVPHTSTAALNHLWGDLMYTGQTFTFTLTEPGTYAYFCEMHPAMVGTISVVDSE